LLVDDDEALVTLFRRTFEHAGYTVHTADNGARAWSALQTQVCDLVVLDVMLPVIDGLELCRRIRAADNLNATKILMLSARGRDSEIAAGLELGADEIADLFEGR
jgi:DNA-binding response OmpR family regulator